MSSQVTIGVIALVFVSACGLISTLGNLRMVEQVNEKLPKEEQIGPLGWYFSKPYGFIASTKGSTRMGISF